jgi:hypothetical protein
MNLLLLVVPAASLICLALLSSLSFLGVLTPGLVLARSSPRTYASTHGSPWSYDTNVPLAMYGPSWIKAGKYGDSEVVDLARTIAFILNVRPPNGCEGRVLSEAMN